MKNRKFALALGLAVLLIGVARYTYAATITIGAATRNTTAAEDTQITNLARNKNGYNCLAVQLTPTCTQVQYDAAPNHVPGTVIYPITVAGVQQFLLDRLFHDIDNNIPTENFNANLSSLGVALKNATTAQFGAACTALGKDPNTCL